MNPAEEARLRLGDLLMDPDATEAQVLAASAELMAVEKSSWPCTWRRAMDGARCVITGGVHWPHEDEHGVAFPVPRGLRVT